MVSKVKDTSETVTKRDANTLSVIDQTGKSRERLMSEIGLSSITTNAQTARSYAMVTFGELDLFQTVGVVREKTEKVKSGDLSELEATLTAQITALDAIFNELARRAQLNLGQHLAAAETYLKLAFRAQAQACKTVQTIGELKSPRSVAFVRQQNVAYQQQINNSDAANGISGDNTHTSAHAHGKILNRANELLAETRDECTYLNTGATATPSENNHMLKADLQTVK